MKQQEIFEDIQHGLLRFDAFSDDKWWNTFTLIVGTIEVGVSIIRSTGRNSLRIFRGFGKEVADQRSNHDSRVLWNFAGNQKLTIIRLNEKGEAIDLSLSRAILKRGMDAQMYGFRMETVDVVISELLV